MQDFQTPRRLTSVERIYGNEGIKAFKNSHVLVAGVGGVGSWCVESLVRSGVGKITMVDMDHIAESNINRQVHALDSTLGLAKIEALKNRLLEVQPDCKFNLIDDFFTTQNVEEIIATQKPDIFIDCIDEARVKVAIALACERVQIPLLMAGGAGGKTDVFSLQTSDIAHVQNDNLLKRVRDILRKEHGFPSSSEFYRNQDMGFQTVWFRQKAMMPSLWANRNSPQGLSCAGYGSLVSITGTMGFALAQIALEIIIKKHGIVI
ncbi:tRNA threonylcarbamoyladenosine dehydratase [Taylorella equigenitalis]|uniref:tRNA threonylcarbamoyladenosine dehydratase n=1 Tax=Taylorella equigenitalis TaxID=29575 RepID=UPI000421D3AC|nr:tRNA threonylcarbamoyladenosine dehydratase [Taylorella equigenitalis]ASY30953.1 tRNA threonylcarbamoyladenosine dehydratase [Taylorella equigenitalis]WDU47626.1 tRNA threonylcarbamoyladenosine dehydratase [Taylorella equigenitalis]WDU53122.1 tRNA threonylcarbamoyladenosine dehydratase [Taylorella equigenitalis]